MTAHLSNSSRDNLAPSRRTFLKLSAGAGAGLVLGLSFPRLASAATEGASAPTFTPFVRIAPDSTVTVIVKHLDKGQGAATGLATLVADELDASWDQIATDFAPANAELYNNLQWGPVQGTGGSSAIANAFEQYRQAGATARAMLVEAAAKQWGVSAAEVSVKAGSVTASSGQSASFGELAEAAAQFAVPENVALKTPDQWVYIGKHVPRLDVDMKTRGSVGVFGMDLQMDDMLVAVLARAPKFGGTVKALDAEAAKQASGVVGVVEVPQGVAVLADTTWQAIQARERLNVEWDYANAETRSSAEIMETYKSLAETTGLPARNDGDAESALGSATKVVESLYEFPFLAHAPMEPIDITILFDGTQATLWTGSQIQTLDQGVTAAVLGIPPENVAVNTLWAGGSFGRRAIYDSHYAAEAASIAKAWGKPQPIKLVYTREDDIRGGYYRPAYVHKVRAGVDSNGNIAGWQHRVVGQSIMTGTPFEEFLVHDGVDHTSVEGISDTSYPIPNFQVELHTSDVRVPPLWWRSVGHTHTAYVIETVVDQVAEAAGKDPVALRRELLANDPRKLGVLNLAAEMAGWGGAVPDGRYRGIAVHKSFDTYVAQVAEISMTGGGTVKVEKIWCAVDCGIAVNPDNIKAQMEGGIGYGLGAILRNEITLTDGEVDQGNFDAYQPIRIDDMPEVEVGIVDSTEPPTGVGEPGVPPIGPAVANAIFAATGSMPTRLPLTQAGLV